MNQESVGWGAIFALGVFIVASLWLGFMAQRIVERGSFIKGYFLGNRSLGSWALALTATVQSGGTFMGFPSFVYSFGWVVALWIAAYMVIPITSFAVLGKRLAQFSRTTGAVTVPDLLRERFQSPALGLVASLFIIFYMSFMLIAQFKAGALIMKLAWPGSVSLELIDDGPVKVDYAYYLGLVIFTTAVVAYTLMGGFLAAVWTDLFQSVLMIVGVLILLPLALSAAGGLENATQKAVQQTSAEFAFAPGYAVGDRQFLPIGSAISFFFIWIVGGIAAPAGMVRIMACRDTTTIRRSIALLSVYNMFIYLPLIAICVCARAILPDLEKSDEVIPRMAIVTTKQFWGGSLLAGLILSAPFGAVMSTVSSYLVVIASGLVRDVYQRFIDPHAPHDRLKWLSHGVMLALGFLAVLANLRPVSYLQAIVVFSTTGAGATFFVPALMSAYWRRATSAGALAAMFTGATTVLFLFSLGWLAPVLHWEDKLAWLGYDSRVGAATAFRACQPLGLDPIIWGVSISTLTGIVVSLLTAAPEERLLTRLFGSESAGERSPTQ